MTKLSGMSAQQSKDSDQPGHLPSLIRVDAQADQSPRCLHEESLSP